MLSTHPHPKKDVIIDIDIESSNGNNNKSNNQQASNAQQRSSDESAVPSWQMPLALKPKFGGFRLSAVPTL